MSFNNNVIDLKARREQQAKKNAKAHGKEQEVGHVENPAAIVDMSEKRQEILKEERRIVKRTILTEFIGAFIIVPQKGLCPVALYDISEDGLAFDIERDHGFLAEGEEVAMRIYMNKKTYFPFVVTIANSRQVPEEGVVRHGVSFVKGSINDVALHHFIKFIESVSSCLEKDSGDILVSNLGK